MSSTVSKVSAGLIALKNTRPAPSIQQKIWHPNRGIVFHQAPSYDTHIYAQSLNEDDNAGVSHNVTASTNPLSDANARDNEIVLTGSVSTIAKGVSGDISEGTLYDEPPESLSSFKMTRDVFKAAKMAEPGSFESYWSHQLYSGPWKDGQSRKPTVHYCKSKHTTERVLKSYFLDQKVLGFDIEWSPGASRHMGARQNVSLIQIASERRIALFHLALYPKSESLDLVSPLFKEIMENPNVTKVGVAIKADCTRLRNFLNIDAHGLFELSHLYKLIKYSISRDYKRINKKLVSLAIQVQEHLHLPLFKGGDVRGSNWSQKLLLNQILYAATDSYAALQLYNTMEYKRKILNPIPPRPHYAELNLPIQVADGVEIETDEEADAREFEETSEKISTSKRSYVRMMKEDPPVRSVPANFNDHTTSRASSLRSNLYAEPPSSGISTSSALS